MNRNEAKTNIGRTVRYTGDACNAPREGYVTAEYSDRWGSYVVVAWDDAGDRESFAAISDLQEHLVTEERKPGAGHYYA